MGESAMTPVPHAKAVHHGERRPSPIYNEYFMDLLPFHGHSGPVAGPKAAALRSHPLAVEN